MYLFSITDPKLRRLLSRFRLSNHKLQIEVGRHIKPKQPLSERICKLCDRNCIEDEEHFIIHCTYYEDIRKEFLSIRHDLGLSKTVNFIEIMACENSCFYLAKCLERMFTKRNVFLTQHVVVLSVKKHLNIFINICDNLRF